MTKYIIFLDNEMKGYLDSEASAKRAVSDLADKLIEEAKVSPASHELRITRENFESGIRIYSQALSAYYFHGAVTLCHTITWKPILAYKLEDN